MESDWPIVDLNTNTIGWRNKAIRVQPIAAELLTALLQSGTRYASAEFLIRRVWGENDDRLKDPVSNLRTRIATLRRQLETLGFTVDVQYGLGWRVVPLAEAKNGHVKRSAALARASK